MLKVAPRINQLTNEQMNKGIITENAAKPLGAYPHARKVGNFCSYPA